MQFSLQRWIRIALFNLLLVAFMGVILRYKIASSLPFIDQKHLQHGHSHFAFAGWITQALMLLLVANLVPRSNLDVLKKYNWVLFANLFTAYGMLIAFPIEGYGLFSITFSFLSAFVSYVFAIMYWKDLNKLPNRNVAHLWFKAALLFNAISSIGTFALAGMMIYKIIHQKWYLAAEYFYLHFQYNGWFFFACMGLFTSKIIDSIVSQQTLKYIFRLFAIAFIPAYFLSVLWMNFSTWIYLLIVAAAFLQLFSWIWLLRSLQTKIVLLKNIFTKTAGWLLALSSIALTIKLILQLGSVIPSLSELSYGFRPIIIGYLHLVLLGVITLFLLGFMVAEKLIITSKIAKTGIIIFTGGIIINEILLMLQGVTALNYQSIPFMNESLFYTAITIFSGLIIIYTDQLFKSHK